MKRSIDTDCSFSLGDKDGCGQQVLWTAHKKKGKKKSSRCSGLEPKHAPCTLSSFAG